ncbi:alpha/beta fold hydrolase [Streptomyces sp. enrichment culture]|uniref:alpha/beta fold hydrolase n=1 Tax=Streptomyces sp. enrichment culture TaxID=1795815 RepID=UPI003F55B426
MTSTFPPGQAPSAGFGRRSAAKGALAGAAALLFGAAPAAASAAPAPGSPAPGRSASGTPAPGGPVSAAPAPGGLRLRLPAPTGPYSVCSGTLHLADPSRNDPWAPEIGVREVVVTVLRPAARGRGFPRVPQLTPAAAASFALLGPRIRPQLPDGGVDWAATLTHARAGAPPRPGRRPVLLYSPGGGDARTMGSSLAVDLASHGWTVLTVDHPGDASEVEFPEERPGRPRVRESVLLGPPAPETFRTMVETRVADLRFVLDALRLDRVGLYGHSAGGTAVAQALHEDRRIAAAANLEGHLDLMDGELLPVARQAADRPLLLAGTDGFRGDRMERTWSALLAHGGPVTRRQLDDTDHWVFTDYAALAPQLQDAGLMTAGERVGMVGAAGPRVTVPAVRRLVRSFFARHLPV